MDDEKYYEIVALELKSGNLKLGLWTKALSLSVGDDAKAKSMYIRFRVEQLIKEEMQVERNRKEEERLLNSEKLQQFLKPDEIYQAQNDLIKIITKFIVVLIIFLVIYALI